jgi:hypothetical protein
MTLKQLYNQFASHPEGSWIMQWENAVLLYDLIKNNSFKNILGLGTGIGLSDAVIALSMKDKGETDYHIDSMEQYDKCIVLANKLIPEELKTNLTIHKADPMVWTMAQVPYQNFSVYKSIPQKEYDLIINDGPSPFVENLNGNDVYVELPNGTIHQMVLNDQIKPGATIVYDGRLESLRLLERYFSENFIITFIPPRGGDFNVLQRLANPVQVKDERYNLMASQTSYFKDNADIIPGDKQSTHS